MCNVEGVEKKGFIQALKIMRKMAMIRFGFYYSFRTNSIFDIPRKMGAELIMSILGPLTTPSTPMMMRRNMVFVKNVTWHVKMSYMPFS
jgi:hypothetical protein